MVEPYGKNGNDSLRKQAFALLDENPRLTAKILCEKLGLPYSDYSNYMTKVKSEWKSYRLNERGSNCSDVHGWRGWCCVPYYVRRDLALRSGWVLSKARNRGLLWRDDFGRMEWFETGRVNLHVRKPANLGRVKQLVSNGFSKTGLIEDFEVLEQAMKTIHFKEAHYVFDTGRPLPKGTIDFFAEKKA